MNLHHAFVLLALVFALPVQITATDRYVSLGGGHVPPFTNWAEAATNIQDAIDASLAGDTVWVTNGVYTTGGKAMAGTMTNRVALDKAITVRSVNGPLTTIINGNGATNGLSNIRGAWLTNGATLMGFSIQNAATQNSGNTVTLQSGGGVWCASASAVVVNCIVSSNRAISLGGGVFQGTVISSLLRNNNAQTGGGAVSNILLNCTVISNSASSGGGIAFSAMTNCIAYFNSPFNYTGNQPISYSCTTPLPTSQPGGSNITANPQLLADSFHLSLASPCRGAGTNVALGTDIDGQAWTNPPAIGCDEWSPVPTIRSPLRVIVSGDPLGFFINVDVVGQPPFTCNWFHNGQPVEAGADYSSIHSTNLFGSNLSLASAGDYYVMVSNQFGLATSAVATVTFRCVDVAGTNPTSPYTAWATAATNIQDAINASASGEIVLVTNGLYATGGKVMNGDLTNRVALDKAVLVHGVNGAAATTVDGASLTNGLAAIRCAWLTNGAVLSGFTLRGGATRTGSLNNESNGGGVWGSSNNAAVVNCIITTNTAFWYAGGAYQVTLINCTLLGNRAIGFGAPTGTTGPGDGGGAVGCNLKNCVLDGNIAVGGDAGGALNCNLQNCFLTRNSSHFYGGAARGGTLINSTVTGNISAGYGSYGGAVAYAALTNCIVWGNTLRPSGFTASNHFSCTLAYSLADPLPSGTGNTNINPQFAPDGMHLSETSPCRGSGTSSVTSGTDIDGQPWINPPTMGCDEWHPAPVIGMQPAFRLGPSGREVIASIQTAGQPPYEYYWQKDGTPFSTGGHIFSADTNLTLKPFGPEDTGNYCVAVSNSFGVVTSSIATLTVHCVDASGNAPTPPFQSWATAATNIQDAIDAAAGGAFILVTNGIYSTGGKTMFGAMTNRVAIDKPITLASVNGPASTIIQGAPDPISTNGPAAVRGVWMTGGAILSGFTVQRGATLGVLNANLGAGGGIWAVSTNALAINCIIQSNTAHFYGGGAYNAALRSCFVQGNISGQQGGGCYGGRLANCTVTGNKASSGGGLVNSSAVNSIIIYNLASGSESSPLANYYYSAPGPQPWVTYSCTSPLPGSYVPSGNGNMNANPQWLSGSHQIAANSPCRGAGTNIASGTDFDGEPWVNPPSIGCDEVWESGLTGPLFVSARQVWPLTAEMAAKTSASFSGTVTGKVARVEWDFGDGSNLTNVSTLWPFHTWTNPGNYITIFTAYNADHPAGVSTNLSVQVLPLVSPTITNATLDGANFSLSFPGQPGARYVVQQTTNLAPPVTWQTVTTVTSTGQVMQVMDTKATNEMRFYRVQGP